MQHHLPHRHEEHAVRYAVVATGRESVPIPFADDLRARIELDADGEPVVEPDYSLRWDGPDEHRLYALNRGRFSHGIPDANLTLLPVRAAAVINSLFDKELIATRDDLCPIAWG